MCLRSRRLQALPLPSPSPIAVIPSPIWTDVSGKRTLVYLLDEKTSAQGFYLFSQTTGVQSPYLPILCGSVTYIYTDIPKELSSVPGLTPATVKAFGQTLNGWTYNDASLKDFCVLYLMDDAGSYGYYTYDSRAETLQRFSGAVFTDSGETPGRPHAVCVYCRRCGAGAADSADRFCLGSRQPRQKAAPSGRYRCVPTRGG